MSRKYQTTNWILQTGRHSESLFPPAFSFPNTFGTPLSLGPSSLNWWTPTPYRKSSCSILSINSSASDLSPVQSFGINNCPLPTQSQGMGSPHVQSGNWPMGYTRRRRRWPTQSHAIQEIRATYCYTVDYKWYTWGWPVVEARKIWSEPWGRIIHWQRFFSVTAKSVFGTL